nr:hypothetical protein [Tanacetum cinerariifolium]
FIQTADPTKVRVAERQSVEDEPRLLETTVGRVVPLLLVAFARASNELEASVDKLFDEGASEDGQGTDIQPVIATTDTIVEELALLQLRRQRKRKSVVVMLADLRILLKTRGEPIPTLPFVTSSVSATLEREDKSHADSVTGLNLRTIDAPVPVEPSLFGVDSSSTSRTDSILGGFSDVSGSDFLIGGIRTIVEPDSDLQKVYLFTEFNIGATHQISLSAEVRMCAEYNIIEKKRIRYVVDEQAELLKVKDGKIKNFKAQLLLKEAEAAEAIRLRAEVFKFEATEKSLQGEVKEHEVTDLDAQAITVKLQNDNLVDRVHELDISSAELQEKVAAYKDFIGQLEKFQDEKMEE